MSLEGIAQIQSRIASIQQMGRPSGGSAPPPGKAATSDFGSLLAEYEGQAAIASGAQSNPGFGTDPVRVNPGFGRTASAAPLAASGKMQRFIDLALEQNGDRYEMSHEVSLDDPNPDTFDCSEIIEWSAKQVGVEFTDGSWLQYLDLKQRGAMMSVEEAKRTPGALLFSFSEEPRPGGDRPSQAHVAISLGDGRTIEARGSEYGVGIFEAGDRFEWAGMIPELA